ITRRTATAKYFKFFIVKGFGLVALVLSHVWIHIDLYLRNRMRKPIIRKLNCTVAVGQSAVVAHEVFTVARNVEYSLALKSQFNPTLLENCIQQSSIACCRIGGPPVGPKRVQVTASTREVVLTCAGLRAVKVYFGKAQDMRVVDARCIIRPEVFPGNGNGGVPHLCPNVRGGITDLGQ